MELDSCPAQGCTVAVAVATYKRPVELAALLRSINRQQGTLRIVLIVVDNDSAGSARDVVLAEAPGATYVIEARRGISAARNAGVERALDFEPCAIAFIDDDEVADPLWLRHLVGTMGSCKADVVTGPVKYVLPVTPADDKYFRQLERPFGSSVRYVATNNTLVRANWFSEPVGMRFDDAYGLTGGGDLEFFLRLQEAGGKCVWDDKAIVLTYVLVERTTRQWILRREMRNGQLIARLRRAFEGQSSPGLVARGARELGIGLQLLTSDVLAGRLFQMSALYRLAAGIGWIRAGFGLYYFEYRQFLMARDREFRKPFKGVR